MSRTDAGMRRRTGGGGRALLEPAWYAGLVLMLAVDALVRNVDSDLPLALVLALWLAAFALPFVVLSAVRRRHQDPRASR